MLIKVTLSHNLPTSPTFKNPGDKNYHHWQLVWDGGYGRPMGLHGGYEVGMGKKPVLTVKNGKYCNYIEYY